MNVILKTVASQQGGIVTRKQALESGYNADEIDRMVRRGDWTRIRRGAYIETSLYEDMSDVERHRAKVHAVLRRLDVPAVVSHVSAVVMHGLPTWGLDLSEVHVSRADLHSPRLEGGVHHHAGDLPGDDVVTVDGVQVTSLARTVIDAARITDFEPAVCVADAAFHRDPGAYDATRARLEQMRDWQGSRNAGSVVSFADGQSESVGESRTRVSMYASGLPEPDLQVEIRTKSGLFVARPDFLFKKFMTVGEFDGKEKYGRYLKLGETSRDVLWREKRREDQLRQMGYEIVRIIWAYLERPLYIKHLFLQAFDRARRSGRVLH